MSDIKTVAQLPSGFCLTCCFSWFDLPWFKTLSCQSPPSMPQSVPPALLSLCVPSSRAPYLWVLVVQCGMWWGGGREAGWPKRGCSIVPTHSINPPLICRSLDHLGAKARQKMWNDGIRDTQHMHTLLLNRCYNRSILNKFKWGTSHSTALRVVRTPTIEQIRSNITKLLHAPDLTCETTKPSSIGSFPELPVLHSIHYCSLW